MTSRSSDVDVLLQNLLILNNNDFKLKKSTISVVFHTCSIHSSSYICRWKCKRKTNHMSISIILYFDVIQRKVNGIITNRLIFHDGLYSSRRLLQKMSKIINIRRLIWKQRIRVHIFVYFLFTMKWIRIREKMNALNHCVNKNKNKRRKKKECLCIIMKMYIEKAWNKMFILYHQLTFDLFVLQVLQQ